MSYVIVVRENFSALIQKLQAIPEDKLGLVVKKHAFKIQADTVASPLMPVDTGALKDSMGALEGKNSMNWIVQDGMEYGIYQELGTRGGVPARHFLGNTCEKDADDFFNDVKRALVL